MESPVVLDKPPEYHGNDVSYLFRAYNNFNEKRVLNVKKMLVNILRHMSRRPVRCLSHAIMAHAQLLLVLHLGLDVYENL